MNNNILYIDTDDEANGILPNFGGEIITTLNKKSYEFNI